MDIAYHQLVFRANFMKLKMPSLLIQLCLWLQLPFLTLNLLSNSKFSYSQSDTLVNQTQQNALLTISFNTTSSQSLSPLTYHNNSTIHKHPKHTLLTMILFTQKHAYPKSSLISVSNSLITNQFLTQSQRKKIQNNCCLFLQKYC